MADKEKLDEMPFDRDATNNIHYAMKELLEALAERRRSFVPRYIATTQMYLNRFLEQTIPLPELNDKSAELSHSLHTYLRKYCDDETTTVLYNLVSEGRGTRVWYEFVNNLARNEKNPKQVRISLRGLVEIDQKTLDERIMSAILWAWGEEDITKAVQDIKDWQ